MATKKPPKHGRFKKGQSGNPLGRPKGSKNLKTMVHDVANMKVTVSGPMGPQTIRVREAVILSTAAKAMKGDPRSQKLFLDLCKEHDPSEIDLAVVSYFESARPSEQEEIGGMVKKRVLDQLGYSEIESITKFFDLFDEEYASEIKRRLELQAIRKKLN